MSSEEQSQTPPFTDSFNLENLAFIDFDSLNNDEKSALRVQLQRRHDFGSKSQWTDAGEREVQRALRKTLLKYKLHKETELFNKCYQYIREYY